MNPFSYYVGLDVHRKSISYCVLLPDGKLVREGKIASTREELAAWALTFRLPAEDAAEVEALLAG